MPKVMPNNPNAEQAILGTIFIEPNKLPDILDRVKENDFYNAKNQAIFKAMKALNNEGFDIDYTSVIEKMNAMNLSNFADLDYIISLSETVPMVSHLDTYINLLTDSSLTRQVINTSNEIVEKGFTSNINANDYLAHAEEKIFALAQKRRTSGFINIDEVVKEVRQNTEMYQNSKDGIIGLQTGFKSLDEVTLGFKPEELIILAARTAVGKSAFALNIALNVAKLNKNKANANKNARVAVFSLEMSNPQLVTRMVSLESDIFSNKILRGQLTPSEWMNVTAGGEALSRLDIVFDDSAAVSVPDIRAKCRQLSQSDGLDFIVIDYLQLVKGTEGTRGGNRQEEVSSVSRGLKQLARELKIPVLALAQLSRAVEQRKDNKPTLADLRESGSIEQDADVVMFLYREDYHKKSKDSEHSQTSFTELLIAKNRQGASGVELKFNFNKPVSRFTEREE